MLDTFKMVVTAFSMIDKANWVKFFEKTFLVANIGLEVVFVILFLTLSGVDVDFSGRELWWRTYTTKKAFPTTRRVELVGKKEFATAMLNPEHETYVVHVRSVSSITSLNSFSLKLDIHPSCKPQMSGLIARKTLTKVSAKYLDSTDIVFSDLASELPQNIKINNHAIALVNSKQPFYGLISSLKPVELEILKAYIKTNLANEFIRPFKSLTGIPILFDQKSNGSLYLCIDS